VLSATSPAFPLADARDQIEAKWGALPFFVVEGTERASSQRYAPIAALVASAATGLFVAASGIADGTRIDKLWYGLAAFALITILMVPVILHAGVPRVLDERIAVIPVAVLAFMLSFVSNGAFGLLAHQIAWGLIGICGLLLAFWSAERQMFPLWLLVFAIGVGLVHVATGVSLGSLFDTAIVTLVLFTAWQVAGAFSGPGGVVRFLGYIAMAYWAVTAIAVVVGLTHVGLGSLTPETIQPPWVRGLNGNKLGYGIVSNQDGRDLTAIVCAYHLARYRWRQERRCLHATLGLAAVALFLLEYGRIPLICGIVVISLFLATSARGTNLVVITVLAALAVFGFASGGSDSGAFSLRLGTKEWDSGHAALWSQQITLFTNSPWGGVGTHPTDDQLAEARMQPIFPSLQTYEGLSITRQTELQQKGSRGEGGWTGMLAQQGAMGGGVVLALIIVGFMTVMTPMRRVAAQAVADHVLLRAILIAALLSYVTEVQPAGFTTFSDYVVLQLTMIAVVTTLRRREDDGDCRHRLGDKPARVPAWRSRPSGLSAPARVGTRHRTGMRIARG
jgi:hypothetical protein